MTHAPARLVFTCELVMLVACYQWPLDDITAITRIPRQDPTARL
jgi:hypothetical protein